MIKSKSVETVLATSISTMVFKRLPWMTLKLCSGSHSRFWLYIEGNKFFSQGKVGKCESGERFLVTGTWSPGNCSSKGDLPSKNKYIGQEEGKKASWEKVRKTFPLFIIESKKKKGLTVIGSPPIGCRFIHKKRKYRPVEKNQACFCFLLVLAANYWFVLQNFFFQFLLDILSSILFWK